jgi:aryl-alcohol dehydrogenase-like predicted oxidoreductase
MMNDATTLLQRPDPLLPERRLGRTGFHVSELTLGGAGLGGLYGPVAEDVGVATIVRAVELGITYIDSSPFYGESEARLGLALAALGERARHVRFSTKVGTHPARFGDYSAATARWSVENSLRQLGVDRVTLVQVHALDDIDMELVLRPGSALSELERMREEGIVGAIGLGVRGAAHHLRAVESGRFDVLLIHDDYSLIRRTDDVVIRSAARADVGVLLGRALMTGLLAGGDPAADPRLADHPDARAARQWWLWARERDVPLRALAIQFALRNPDVASVVVGASSPREIEESVEAASRNIPIDVWTEVEERMLRSGTDVSA